MYEKISNEAIRLEKVKKLKEKIAIEIDERITIYKSEMQSDISENDFNYCVKNIFVLLELKEYLDRDTSFMSYEVKDYDKDIVVYMISDRDLTIWLQNDYFFVINFLNKVEENRYNVFPLLNDKYFGYNFTNIFD